MEEPKYTEESGGGGEQAVGTLPEEPSCIDSDMLCRKCHWRVIDKSENSHSILCSKCREEQIHYPFPQKAIPVVIGICGILAVAMIRTPRVLHDYRLYTGAKEQAEAGDIYPALLDLEDLLTRYSSSVPIAERMVDLAMEHGYYEVAAYALNTYMAGKSVDDSTYSRISRYQTRLDQYYDTINWFDEQMTGLQETMEAEGEAAWEDEEKMEQFILDWKNDRKADMLDMTKDSTYDGALLYYYCALFTDDGQEARDYLIRSVEKDPLFVESQVVLGTNYRRAGELESAEACYEAALSVDSLNASALRGRGILRMLNGQLEEGLSDVQTAFDTNPETEYVRETLIIALMENGRDEEARQRKQEFDETGVVFDESFDEYLSGAVDLHSYYIGE